MAEGFGGPLGAVRLLQGMTAWTLLVGAGNGDPEARWEHAVAVAERVLFSG